jgi:multidrug resistance efflux pump
VTTNFNEMRIRKRRAGQRVTIVVEIHSHRYHGRVESFVGSIRAAFRPLPVARDNSLKVAQRGTGKTVLGSDQDIDHRLKSGMLAEPKVRGR